MEVYKHKNHTVYQLKKRVLFFKNHRKMLFWHKGKLVKNHRFNVSFHKNWRYVHWFIRQPFFYFERNNSGLYIGTPNKYIHFQNPLKKALKY